MRRSLMQRLVAPGLRVGALSLTSKIALGVLATIVVVVVAAPVVSLFDPLASGTPVQPPSGTHWFGTDRQGRDIFSRVVHGGRYSLTIGLAATAMALAAAAILGAVAATSRKWVSELLLRVLDIVMSFPGIALAAVFVSVFGRSLHVLVFIIAFLYVPQLTRVVRANILAQYGEDYVSAARVIGASTTWILTKHVARNCIAPIMVFATVLVADAIILEASLSFIQAGVPDPDPPWGNVIAAGRGLVMSGYWCATFFPGAAIMLTVLALNILSEGMTDAMVAPKAPGTARSNDGVQALEERGESTKAPAPIVAAAIPTVSLEDRLEQLRVSEGARDTRLHYLGDQEPLLEVKNLSIRFPEQHGDVDVVDSVSFTVRPGETMALVGESGCGKSLTSLAIMGLLPSSARVTGEILYNGTNLLELDPESRNALRGHEMAMVYQDALSSLNPSMLVRSQLRQLTSRGGVRTAEELLELVGLEPRRTLRSYPHELSGGQRQRVLIAMALTRNPRLIVADEPTTALDVTVQAQVVGLLNELREAMGFSMVFVSHDLALVSELAHRVTVMYAGQIVEQGPTTDILARPMHEYTRGLLGSVLSIESGAARLHQIPGTVPSPRDFPPGDRFAPRSERPGAGRGRRAVLRQVAAGGDHLYASHDAPTKGGQGDA